MVTNLDLSSYHLTFDDEFNSFNSTPYGTKNTWATTLWGIREFNSTGGGDQAYFSDSSVGTNPFSAAGGVLTITAAPGTNPAGRPYNSGVIDTKAMFSQTYGYFEMRAELPAGAGMWPAFWTQDANDYAAREIDALEAFGAPNSSGAGGPHATHWDVHDINNPAGQGAWVPLVPDTTTGFHAYGVMWNRADITFYFDGQQIAEIPTPADLNVPQYLIANLAVGSQWPGSATGEAGQMKIDYIRAFSSDPSQPAVALQPVSSPDGGGTDLHGASYLGMAPPAADTLTLLVSEDAWNGDAQFTVAVDGVQVGGVQHATALHSSHDSSVVSLTGDWGKSLHDVQVTFINDAYGGTSQTDRNLYVDALALDGTTYAGTSAALYWNGAKNFAVGGATAAAPGPVDTLTLHLAEDAAHGDAQFTVSIDGHQISTAQAVTQAHDNIWENFSFAGSFGAGPHTIDVNFVNPAAGRVLYVNGADVDGTYYYPSTWYLSTNGAASYHVTTSH